MQRKGTRRLFIGAALIVMALAFYSVVVAPQMRQIEAMAGSFMGAMALSSFEGQQAMQEIGTLRLNSWIAGLIGAALAVWGWRLRQADVESRHASSDSSADVLSSL